MLVVRRRPRRRSRTRRRRRECAGTRRPRCARPRVCGAGAPSASSTGLHAGGPDHRRRSRSRVRRACGRACRRRDATSAFVRTSTPRRSSSSARVPRQPGLERRQQPVAAFEQHDADLVMRELGILLRKHEPHELAERAGVLDAGRTAADDAERQQPAPFVGVGRARRPLEAVEHVVAQLQRFAEVLQPERVRARARRCRRSSCGCRPRARRGRTASCGAVGEVHDLRRRSRCRRRRPCGTGRSPAPRNTLRSGAAMSPGLEQAARDLVQQRREQVVVAPVDEHDVDRLVAQLAGRTARPPKPAPMITTRGRTVSRSPLRPSLATRRDPPGLRRSRMGFATYRLVGRLARMRRTLPSASPGPHARRRALARAPPRRRQGMVPPRVSSRGRGAVTSSPARHGTSDEVGLDPRSAARCS